MSTMISRILRKEEIGCFAPFTWKFWRALFIMFFITCLLGHWLEIPYVNFMSQFGIVSDDYAALIDPWYVPYWVYGIGAVVMTWIIEPIKESVIEHRKTPWGALLETFLITVVLAAILETGIGLIINQPDAAGEFPFWDNSQLPLNILGQGWLVNDLVIGVVAMVYVWILYPVVYRWLEARKPWMANLILAVCVIGLIACCIVSYAI